MPARPLLLLPLLCLAACAQAPPPAKALGERAVVVEARKDALVAELADCESGGRVEPRGGPYVGRFQFSPGTVIAFVRQRDGRTITNAQAVALAADYAQASALVKYILFERDGASHWPACGRKIGLARRVAEIRAL